MHQHHDDPADYTRAFKFGLVLNGGLIIVEFATGLYINSLALMADAGHNLSDVLGLMLAWGAHVLTRAQTTERRTYGWRSTSIFAAILNGLILMLVTGSLTWEALARLKTPAAVGGMPVIVVASIGVVINTITALLFVKGRHRDLNLQGAFLHMAADAAVSLGVVLSGVALWAWDWFWIDPLASLAIGVVIFASTWGLLRDAVNLALHAVPKHIDVGQVRVFLADLPGVTTVHDLHVWAMSTTEPALTAHLVKPHVEDDDVFLAATSAALHDRFGIQHVTLQIERGDQMGCHQLGNQCGQ